VGFDQVSFNTMGERKVLNRYFPPDFDPAKIPRKRMDAKYAMNIRMMMPMSIQVGRLSSLLGSSQVARSKPPPPLLLCRDAVLR
jgi:hypothetical protein